MLLDGHGKQFSNKDFEEVVKGLSQQEEEENTKDEEPPLNHMKTSNIKNILSDIETLSDQLWENDHEWGRSAKV